MSAVIPWMAAEVERAEEVIPAAFPRAGGRSQTSTGLKAGPATGSGQAFPQRRRKVGHPRGYAQERQEEGHEAEENGSESFLFAGDEDGGALVGDWEAEQEKRIYRGRTVAMLRRYMRYALETGRLPSLLGREFFRTKVTRYTVVTFEDRVIFVHDMEICLERLDEFLRQIIARRVLQEHDCWATARLLQCNEKTVRRLTPIALDQLSEILLEVGLMERIEPSVQKSCQGGLEEEVFVSDWQDGKNKF